MEDLKESIINSETSNMEVVNNAEVVASDSETQKMDSVEPESLQNQEGENENVPV